MRVRRLVNSARDAWRRLTRPPEGRVYRYDPSVDSARSALTRGLTFTRLATILQNGDDGDIPQALTLFEEMERADARVFSVAGTRRRALTGPDYEIVSAADTADRVDKVLADEAAVYARERLDGLDSVDGALSHLATAIGPNLAVLELVWELGELVDMVPVPTFRLAMNPQQSLAIRVITAEERTYGVEASEPKFAVHIPNGMSGSPIDRSLSRAQAFIWLYKYLALSDLAAFCELFGMPVRVGKYDTGVSDTERTALKNMIENLGTRAWALVSRAVDIEFVESTQRGTAPYQAFLDWLNRETGILWLGANLTSDTTGGTGTFAAASVQDNVRDDIRDDDMRAEARTIRNQILAPMVGYKFAGRDVPVPSFERIVAEDSLQLAARVMAWQKVGLRVPEDWARAQSGIPEPGDGEAVLEPPDAFAEGLSEGMPEGFGGPAGPAPEASPPTLNELTLGIERAVRAGDTDLVARLRAVLDKMLGEQL